MKNKTYRFAAVAAVLLAFCLVFMTPVGAEVTGVDTAGELQTAFNNGGDVKLVADITLG